MWCAHAHLCTYAYNAEDLPFTDLWKKKVTRVSSCVCQCEFFRRNSAGSLGITLYLLLLILLFQIMFSNIIGKAKVYGMCLVKAQLLLLAPMPRNAFWYDWPVDWLCICPAESRVSPLPKWLLVTSGFHRILSPVNSFVRPLFHFPPTLSFRTHVHSFSFPTPDKLRPYGVIHSPGTPYNS